MSASTNPVNLAQVYKMIRPRKPSLPILANLIVEDGQAMVTDLDIWGLVNVDMPNGVYQLAGKEFVAYPETAGYSLDGAPKLPEEDLMPAIIPFPRAALQAALRFTVNNSARLLWNVICLKVRADRMDIIATDQFALSTHAAAKPGGIPEGDYLLPAKAVQALLLDKHSETLTIAAGKEYVSLSTPSLNIVTRMVNGSYYAVDQITPKELNFVSKMNKKEFRKALKDLKPYLDDDRTLQITPAAGCSFGAAGQTHGYNLTAKNPAKYLEKTVFIESSTEPGGRVCSNNIMLVMPKGDPAAPVKNSLLLGHRYLDQVSASISGSDIYMGFQSYFGDLKPVTFSGEPLCGGGTI
jgi:hypothetical protein